MDPLESSHLHGLSSCPPLLPGEMCWVQCRQHVGKQRHGSICETDVQLSMGQAGWTVPQCCEGHLVHCCCCCKATHSALKALGAPPASVQHPSEFLPAATQHPFPAATRCCHAASQQHGSGPVWSHQQRMRRATGQHHASPFLMQQPLGGSLPAGTREHTERLQSHRAASSSERLGSARPPPGMHRGTAAGRVQARQAEQQRAQAGLAQPALQMLRDRGLEPALATQLLRAASGLSAVETGLQHCQVRLGIRWVLHPNTS